MFSGARSRVGRVAAGAFQEVFAMRFISASFPCFAWLGGALFTLAVFAPAQADEYRLRPPLDDGRP